MSKERDELLSEANNLGLEFHSNIPFSKLQALVSEAKGEPIPVEEEAPKSPAVKAEKPVEENTTKEKVETAKVSSIRKLINERKKAAFKTQIVTITNKDNRENDFMTTVYLSFENQYFGLSKIVPLDVPVELEQALIDICSSTVMSLHKDEIIDGKRTGNKVATRVKKFAISYGRQQSE